MPAVRQGRSGHRGGRSSQACDACARRKSRCELVTAEGCHRCVVLGTGCSLAEVVEGVEANSSNAIAPAEQVIDATEVGPASGVDNARRRASSGTSGAISNAPYTASLLEQMSGSLAHLQRLVGNLAEAQSSGTSPEPGGRDRSLGVAGPRIGQSAASLGDHARQRNNYRRGKRSFKMPLVELWYPSMTDLIYRAVEVPRAEEAVDPVEAGLATENDISWAFSR